jgi:POT family proton-dependent oligopeptide transporter
VSQSSSGEPVPHTGGVPDFLRAVLDLRHLPRAFWIMVGVFSIDAMAYFGVLTLMEVYLSTDLGWGDTASTMAVSVFTGLVTLFMLGAGSYAEGFGLRRAVIGALVLCVVGRLIYCLVPGAGLMVGAVVILGALLVTALGEAVIQPVCYSGVKQYSDERTSTMGYGLIYAIMNLGIVIMGAISAWVRPGVQAILDARKAGETPPPSVLTGLANHVGSGIQAVNWISLAITVCTLLGFLVVMTRRAEAAKIRPDRVAEHRKTETRALGARFIAYFTEGPFANLRFIVFIFLLLPVQTLWAHQWLTMPAYILRAYPPEVGNRMEWIVNWINPGIVVVGVPLFTALTRRVNIFTMILLGTFVQAAPTFLLTFTPQLSLLITYMVIFSIGETLWSARFLEYAAELAPEGRVAQYMGLANVPWLLAKSTTGLYAGWLLGTYCPPDTPRELLHTGTLWTVYTVVALITPIGLLLVRKWVIAGLRTKPAAKAAVAPA